MNYVIGNNAVSYFLAYLLENTTLILHKTLEELDYNAGQKIIPVSIIDLIKKEFEDYLDPRQVKHLQNNPEAVKLGGEKRYCTFLFTDVRGFTALSEILEPEEVTHIMNRALTIQSNAVKKYGGMVDKYIGDAMMAIFNAPIDLPEHEHVAILCAKQIQQKIQQADLGVEIGIGVNSGYAVVGNMGSETRFDYTAIGDAVNLAARLESSTKEVGRDIVIGYDTVKNCNIYVDKLKDIFVKGKEKPIQIYTLDSYDKSTGIT